MAFEKMAQRAEAARAHRIVRAAQIAVETASELAAEGIARDVLPGIFGAAAAGLGVPEERWAYVGAAIAATGFTEPEAVELVLGIQRELDRAAEAASEAP